MSSNAVPNFVPSRDGFPFANAWPHVPTIRPHLGPLAGPGIGDAANGLCGGMSFSVRDMFDRHQQMPVGMDQPPAETDRFRYIVDRQVDSFDYGRVPLRFYTMMLASPERRDRDVVGREWPRIRAEIDGGRLAIVGLVRSGGFNPFNLTKNHQVMAWGYDAAPDALTLRLYDPNHAGADDVVILLALTPDRQGVAELKQSTGEPLLGFFLAPYSGRDPVAFR